METPASGYHLDALRENGSHYHANGKIVKLSEHHKELIKEPTQDINEKLASPELLSRFELDFAPVDKTKVEEAIESMLYAVGEDPEREGLQRTPHRVAKAYTELLSGYTTDPAKLINDAVFDVEYDDMVIVRDIEYYSLCEHHMLPFMGHAHVAYIPSEKVVGLSKIPRIVDMFSRRLQVQERLTQQIAEFINEVLEPKGVAVVMDGSHMCSMIRGVGKVHSGMSTSAMIGEFKMDKDARREFLDHIQRASNNKNLL